MFIRPLGTDPPKRTRRRMTGFVCPMRVLFINNLYPPAGGGAERIVQRQVQTSIEEGHEVHLVTLSARERMFGLTVHPFSAWNIFPYTALAGKPVLLKVVWHIINVWNIFAANKLKKIIEQIQPDVVHTHNLMGIGFLTGRIIRGAGSKHVHTIHDIQLVDPSGVLPWNHLQESFFQGLYSAATRAVFGSPDEIIAPSTFLENFYKQRRFFEKSAWSTQEVAHVVGMRSVSQAKKFLYVGSLTKQKGIDVLMRAWEQLDGNDIHLSIVGGGPERHKVEEWAAKHKNVTTHGQLSSDALNTIYKDNDVLIFPSVCIENRPNVIIEAHKHGLFVIASKTGGVPELISKENGVLVTPEEVGVLVEAITACIRTPMP